MPVFVMAIFLSAFLLFQVQPIVARYILPWYGGSPAVWTACMLCFQVGLLGGYAYAHGLVSLLRKHRGAQVGVHLALLVVSMVMLPITPDESLKPTGDANPVFGIVWLLARTVGLPYLVVSASGPLLQHWFAEAGGGRSPYRLYAVSNLGSLLGLLSYPFVFEPAFGLGQQTWLWSGGYAGYAILAGACAWIFVKKGAGVAARNPQAAASGIPARATTVLDRILWVALPACGSVLLLATTSQMTQDVAVVPFLWIIPLGLYLVTFIISFDHARWYNRAVWIPLTMISVGGLVWLLNHDSADREVLLAVQIAIYVSAMFCAVMVCHGEVVRLKPDPSALTGFYLAISLGGALGGVFVSLVAPRIFDGYWELHIGLVSLALLAVVCLARDFPQTPMRRWLLLVLPLGVSGALMLLLAADHWSAPHWVRVAGVALVAAVVMILLVLCLRARGRRIWAVCGVGAWAVASGVMMFFLWKHMHPHDDSIAWRRGFYGVLHVCENEDLLGDRYRTLHHGRISHGVEYLTGEEAGLPTTYYAQGTGAQRVFELHPNRREGGRKPMHYGVVGLGTGTLAAFAEPGDRVRIYEINRQVEELARKEFGYLGNCMGSESVVLGDARITMERELAGGESQAFDALFIDAFSGDSIPIHLMTREAFELYFRHLQPNGVLAVHITNLHLDLSDPVRVLAREMGAGAVWVEHWTEDGYGSDWVLISRDKGFLAELEQQDGASEWKSAQPREILWTDDYSNLLDVIHWDPDWDWLWRWIPGLGRGG